MSNDDLRRLGGEETHYDRALREQGADTSESRFGGALPTKEKRVVLDYHCDYCSTKMPYPGVCPDCRPLIDGGNDHAPEEE
jgi:hypothetical protein